METRQTHETRIVVWDTPTALESGAPIRFKVGVKCAAECGTAVRRVEIRDADGRRVASASIGDAQWPGTSGLYYAELEVRAPETVGLHAWEAYAAPVAGETAGPAVHAGASVRFQVRVVPAPECRLTIVALDARNRVPIEGARVVIHPYRALTDAHGVAEIRVPKGAYRLFVSGRNHFPFRSDGEVNSDMTIRAELDVDLGPTDAELWS